MTFLEFFQAFFLGLVEAATEFLPVSSTGHLIIASELIGFKGPAGHVFEIAIQVGAMLAVLVLYFKRLWTVIANLHTDPAARHFAIVSVIAFIPAVITGFLLHNFIKTYLFSPWVVCLALIIGGIAILAVERFKSQPRITSIESIPYGTSLVIGLIQCLALIPGVSRSGATILGALCCGVDRRTAAEFSFFQAIPLLTGAALFDMWKNRAGLDWGGGALIIVGFVTSFVGAIFVIRWMLDFIMRRGFAPFAWYRIVVGAIGLIWLAIIPAS
jgi:undecaprenyl-diphosphatase